MEYGIVRMIECEDVPDEIMLKDGTKNLFAFNLILREQIGCSQRLVKTGGQNNSTI